MISVLSLGAGVQSSTLALMLDDGELGPKYPRPAFAVFADTQREPRAVYHWLEWLGSQLSYPIYTVTKGDLGAAVLRRSRRSGNIYLNMKIPMFTVNRATGQKGMLIRTCTRDYKIHMVHREIIHRLSIPRGSKNVRVHQYMGISVDEAHRMKPSIKPCIKNVYPLVELSISRQQCIDWMEKHYKRTPPRSACTFCPFHNDEEWAALTPKEFKEACELEDKLRRMASKTTAMNSDVFLHASRIPLRDVVLEPNKKDHWGNECEGGCGV